MVLVCTRNRDELDAHTCVVNHTYVVDDLRADPDAGVGCGLDNGANVRAGDEVSHRNGLRRSSRVRLSLRLGIGADDRACLGRCERVLKGRSVVNDLRRDPDTRGGHQLRRGHNLSRSNGLDVRHGLCHGLGHRYCCWYGHSLRTRRETREFTSSRGSLPQS